MTDSGSNVSAALDLLLEQVEIDITLTNEAGILAFERRSYEETKEAIETSQKVGMFREKVAALCKEWQEFVATAEETQGDKQRAARRNLGRLPRGLRTPESAYYVPILQVLQASGGSAKAGDVIEQVGEIMKEVFRDVDYDPVASNSSLARWRNAAQFARNGMVGEGLVKPSSQYGVWEISEQGRAKLTERT